MKQLLRKYFEDSDDFGITILTGMGVSFLLWCVYFFIEASGVKELLTVIVCTPVCLSIVALLGTLTRMSYDKIMNKINKRGNK